MLKHLFRAASSLIFPAECETCRAVLKSSQPLGICAGCESEIRFIPPPHCVSCGRHLRNGGPQVRRSFGGGPKCGECPAEGFHFDRAFACALYEGKMKELIHSYKFNRRKYLRDFFVKIMAEFARAHLNDKNFDAVAAVPLDRDKRKTRGFNQSGLISARLAAVLHISDASNLLRRTGRSSPQSLLGKKERLSNVRGRFLVKGQSPFRAKHVLLVDDILTTGQTASECAKALKEAGASAVTVLASARGI